jgi:hypothetical protein
MTNEVLLSRLAQSLRVFVAGFMDDPGTPDLDGEQPIDSRVTLEDWRKARYLIWYLDDKRLVPRANVHDPENDHYGDPLRSSRIVPMPDLARQNDAAGRVSTLDYTQPTEEESEAEQARRLR